MSKNIDKVITIVAEILNRNDIDEHSTRDDIAEWDSLAYMEIAGRVEQELGIEIKAENIEKFNSVLSIATMLPK